MPRTIHMDLPWRRFPVRKTYCGLAYVPLEGKFYLLFTCWREEVTCKNCLASLDKMDREYPA